MNVYLFNMFYIIWFLIYLLMVKIKLVMYELVKSWNKFYLVILIEEGLIVYVCYEILKNEFEDEVIRLIWYFWKFNFCGIL